MSKPIRLAKTKDSRTRRKPKAAENTEAALILRAQLQKQGSFASYLLQKGYSSTTTRRYLADAEQFIQWAAKENITIETTSYADILHYIQKKKKHVKQRTISAAVNSIKHYFAYLKTTGAIADNPTTQIQIKGIKRRILYNILSKQELESLYHNFEIPDTANDPNKNQNWFKTSILASKRNKVILGLIIYQGLGTTELDRLTAKDLKLREGKIYVAGSRQSNERELKLEAHQVLDIMEYTLQTRNEILARTGKASEMLFVSTGESPHFRSIIQKLMQKLKKQNSKVTSVKQLRASVITHWLKIYNLREAQQMAGHRYVSSTEAYLINDLEDLQEDISKFHPIG